MLKPSSYLGNTRDQIHLSIKKERKYPEKKLVHCKKNELQFIEVLTITKLRLLMKTKRK